MSDYIERMKKEHDELCDKHDKLTTFITSLTFEALEHESRELMIKQHVFMGAYIDILNQRIMLVK